MGGYFKIFRDSLSDELFHDPLAITVYLWLCLNAAYADKEVGGRKIKKGQVWASVRFIVKALKMGHKQVHYRLKSLEAMGLIRKHGALIDVIPEITMPEGSVIPEKTKCYPRENKNAENVIPEKTNYKKRIKKGNFSINGEEPDDYASQLAKIRASVRGPTSVEALIPRSRF